MKNRKPCARRAVLCHVSHSASLRRLNSFRFHKNMQMVRKVCVRIPLFLVPALFDPLPASTVVQVTELCCLHMLQSIDTSVCLSPLVHIQRFSPFTFILHYFSTSVAVLQPDGLNLYLPRRTFVTADILISHVNSQQRDKYTFYIFYVQHISSYISI